MAINSRKKTSRSVSENLDTPLIPAISLAWVGKLAIPDAPRLAYYGGVAALAAFGFLEFPVAGVITVGHALAHQHRNKAFAELGEALEEA